MHLFMFIVVSFASCIVCVGWPIIKMLVYDFGYSGKLT